MSLVTILTPTYNRAALLPVLFDSLLAQSSLDFEWLIVDDGSKDNTAAVVKTFQEKAPFSVRYLHKENGGKHTALNAGMPTIASELTFIVDSDDRLLPDAIKEISASYEKYQNRSDISGISFLRAYANGKAIVPMDRDEFVESYITYRIAQNRPGDMAEVFFTEILKQYPFPEFPGERFLSEDVVWIEMGKKYLYVFINKPIYECEYLEAGLTANDKPAKFASPKGSMLRGKQLMTPQCGLKANIRGAIIYNCYRKLTDHKIPDERLLLSTREKLFVLLTMPLGTVFYHKWKPQ